MSSINIEEPITLTSDSVEKQTGSVSVREKTRSWSIRPEGESGRKGIHPWKFIVICFRSSCHLSQYVNVLWPFVPAALVLVS